MTNSLAQPHLGLKRSLVGTGISQRDIARKLGITEDLLSRYLNGFRKAPDNFETDFNNAFRAVREEKTQRMFTAEVAV